MEAVLPRRMSEIKASYSYQINILSTLDTINKHYYILLLDGKDITAAIDIQQDTFNGLVMAQSFAVVRIWKIPPRTIAYK